MSNHLLQLQKEIKEEEDEIFADIDSLINNRSYLYTSSEEPPTDDAISTSDVRRSLFSSFQTTVLDVSDSDEASNSFNPIETVSNQNNNNNNSHHNNNNNNTSYLLQSQRNVLDAHLFSSTSDSDSFTEYYANCRTKVGSHDFTQDSENSTDHGRIKQFSPNTTSIGQHQSNHHQRQLQDGPYSTDLKANTKQAIVFSKRNQQQQHQAQVLNVSNYIHIEQPQQQHHIDEDLSDNGTYENDSASIYQQQTYNECNTEDFNTTATNDHDERQNYDALQAVIHQVTSNLPKPCVFFLEGNCRRSDCKYSHDLSNITCKYWIEGFCFKGDLCPFMHSYTPPGDPQDGSQLDDDKLNELKQKNLNPTFVIESEADFPSLPLDAPTHLTNDGSKTGSGVSVFATKSQILTSNPAVVFKTVKKKRKKG